MIGKFKTYINQFLVRNILKTVVFTDAIDTKPVSSIFGLERGTPIDRHYIEKFLSKNRERISGDCLEVGDSVYAKKFGSTKSIRILEFDSEKTLLTQTALFCDLGNPEAIPEAIFDTIICTQTLNFIFDLEKAMRSIYKLLRPGGSALLTVGGISQISKYDYERWGDYWRFTDHSLSKLAQLVFRKENCTLLTFGNVATSCLFLQGVAYEDVKDKSIFEVNDSSYQMIIVGIFIKD
ncbi:methyltransferase domain-containing protein [Leptospira ognonensis]|uniref:Methyltransferase domain-containing protein n=1 Tax=Leptospira ognonensis TaxID=2484945 RepID=A0A4R9K5X1_9LEPT|nr:methyltransferase domain-containing protein [Leptospira ognonensis]TGL59768.1 methyltransferase domain-containing protein [Leptospira ognonensis]